MICGIHRGMGTGEVRLKLVFYCSTGEDWGLDWNEGRSGESSIIILSPASVFSVSACWGWSLE